jgi:hypothetical protein
LTAITITWSTIRFMNAANAPFCAAEVPSSTMNPDCPAATTSTLCAPVIASLAPIRSQ